jgi:hypothetical protein
MESQMNFIDKIRDGLNVTFHVLLILGGSVVFMAGIGTRHRRRSLW